MKLVMERAKNDDAKALVNIYHAAYAENEKLGFPASASKVTIVEVQDWIKNTILLIAKEENTFNIIGTVRLKYHEEWQCYVLGRLAVKPSYKGMGIATRLMKYAEDELINLGETSVKLTVAQGHPYLPNMYTERGYKIVGELLLDDVPYDEFIMERELNLMESVLTFKKVPINERKNFMELLLLADESEDVVNEYINEGDMFSISIEKKVIGVALFIKVSPFVVELKNVALSSGFRGKGFGKEIIKLASALYKEKSFTKMTVGTANSSIDNIAFYQKAGFRIVGIRKNFFAKYPEPIYENGIQAIDMIMFEIEL